MALTLASCGGLYIDSETLKVLKATDNNEVVTVSSAESVTSYINACGLLIDSSQFDVLTKNGRNQVITKKGILEYPTNVIFGICGGVLFDGDYFVKNEDNSIGFFADGVSTTVTFTIDEGILPNATIELKNSSQDIMENNGTKNVYVVPSGDTYTWTVTTTENGSDSGSFEATGQPVGITPNLTQGGE